MKVKEELKGLIDKAEALLKEAREHLKTTPTENGRFKTLLDGWVLDKALGIEWGPSSKDYMTFDKANKYAEEQGGRLPTVKELRTIVDYDRHEPAIDTDFFKDTKNNWYWTSTECAWNSSCAWCVYFYYGNMYYSGKGNDGYVRPVRASQCLIL